MWNWEIVWKIDPENLVFTQEREFPEECFARFSTSGYQMLGTSDTIVTIYDVETGRGKTTLKDATDPNEYPVRWCMLVALHGSALLRAPTRCLLRGAYCAVSLNLLGLPPTEQLCRLQHDG